MNELRNAICKEGYDFEIIEHEIAQTESFDDEFDGRLNFNEFMDSNLWKLKFGNLDKI